MDILIVGGTGCISFAVVNESIRQGHRVTCVNRGRSSSQKLPSEVEHIVADYRDLSLMRQKLEGRHFDVVVDFLCMSPGDITYSVNLFKDKCRQYIFISSCAVYNAEARNGGIYDEDAPKVTRVWRYSVNKVASEKMLYELGREQNFTYTIVRPAVTYGNTRIPYGITPPYGYHGTLIQRLLHGKPIISWDKGEGYINITRVEDFAVGFVGLYGNPKAFNQAFNIVGDEFPNWKEVINTTADLLGVKPYLVDITSKQFARETPTRKGEILGGRAAKQACSNHKLKDAVPGFKTNIHLREGIRLTLDYYRKNDYLYGIDYKFDGDWDRIAAKYDPNYKPRFIDYLGNATEQDVKDYENAFHKNVTVESLKIRLIPYKRKMKSLVKAVLAKLKQRNSSCVTR